MKPTYRIHGDNIIECEVAISTILESIQFTAGSAYTVKLVESSAVTPAYEASFDDGTVLVFEFFPGHNRWNVSLPDYILQLGAPLKESVDAFVTKVRENIEEPIAAFEFSNALPAGNNAWQRAGRALSMVRAEIPYFYFAEIGGQELDADRNIKAPRFPNPIVAFSYLSISSAAPEKCTTVYLPSRSINKETYDEFSDAFANSDYKYAIASLFTEKIPDSVSLDVSKDKSADFVYDLANRRKRNNTHSLESWKVLLTNSRSGTPVAPIFLDDKLGWSKKISIPSQPTLPKLIIALIESGAVAVGSVDMPFCVIAKDKRLEVATRLHSLYGDTLSDGFIKWLGSPQKDLVVTMVAGFKPRGDDSRPDRGLVPLARMIFANDDVDLLSVVYGPAKAHTWNKLFSDYQWLATNNGLWEAVLNLSNAVLVDSMTWSADFGRRDVLLGEQKSEIRAVQLAKFSNVPRYGEHDVDSVLHLLFSNAETNGVFEALCNPPGGDWSGVSLVDSEGATNRWTSLPRVTGIDGKRPDHIIQFFGDHKVVLSVESKDILRNLEEGVGPRLDYYTKALLVEGVAQSRKLKDSLEWSQEIDLDILKETVSEYEFLSAVAVMGGSSDAKASLEKSSANASFAITFHSDGSTDLFFSCNNTKLKQTILDFLSTQQVKLGMVKVKVTVVD